MTGRFLRSVRQRASRLLPTWATGCRTWRTPVDPGRVAVQDRIRIGQSSRPQSLFSKLENRWCRGVEALARDRLRRQQQLTAW